MFQHFRLAGMAASGVAIEVMLERLHASMMEESTAVQSTPSQVPVAYPNQPHQQRELNSDGQVEAGSENVPAIGG